jgi:protein arginine kinase activator
MLCNQCNEREAVVHLTQIGNDQVLTVHLCERCAAEKGVESTAAVAKTPVGNFLASLGTTQPPRPGEATVCRSCGATLADFRETGRFGCPECYRTYEGSLRELLRRLHGSSRHLGERYVAPDATRGGAEASESDLRDQLRLAIETENFELAAELRDRLRVLGLRE